MPGTAGGVGVVLMKRFRWILIVTEVLLGVLLMAPLFIESRPLARAIMAYDADPSLETKREVEQQQVIVARERLSVKGAMLGLLCVNTAGLIIVSRRCPWGNE